MYILNTCIEIQSKDTKKTTMVKHVNSVSVKTSIGNLTDTASITLAKTKGITNTIKVGDKVRIELGYKTYSLHEVFTGYVQSVSNKTPLVLECENKMWDLKHIEVPAKRYPAFDLKSFLSEFVPGVKLIIPDQIEFGEVIIKEPSTVSKVLDYLMQNYPFRCFFKGMDLVAMLLTSQLTKNAQEHVLTIGKNIISNSLVYTPSQDIKIIIKAKSIVDNKTKLEVQAPQKASEGEVRTFYNPHCKTKQELQEYADKMLLKYKENKMSGSLTLFGLPSVLKGDKIQLKEVLNPQIDGKRFVAESVNYTFGVNGYRQEVTLGDELK